MTDAEIVIPRFGHSVNLASTIGALPIMRILASLPNMVTSGYKKTDGDIIKLQVSKIPKNCTYLNHLENRP